MALGSSAPEILLSVIETVSNLDTIPGELGPSTIVGSAAFNLLVISGVSIAAVGEKPKQIADMRVFFITATSSLFAYVWMLVVLKYWTPGFVTIIEAVLTLFFFFLLIILAFAADKYTQKQNEKKMSKLEVVNRQKKLEALHAKDEIHKLIDEKGMSKAYLLEEVYVRAGHRQTPRHPEIHALFRKALGVEDLSSLELADLNKIFEADSELQQIRYKRAFGRVLGAKRDFVIMKGQVGQQEHILENA